jgi:steroid delta-isomerase-like uncharacterized protein
MTDTADSGVINRFYEQLINRRDQRTLRELIGENIVMHDPTIPGGVLRGREAFAQFVGGLLTAFPDMRMTAEDQVVQGNRVAARWHLRATHSGPLMDIPPTGREVNLEGMDFFTISNGEIVEMWVALDTLSLMQQVGALPQAASR